MFNHYVITRFNLKLENHFQKDKNGNPTQTEEWLKRRFELFDTYCFPSIQAQSCQQFKWLVLFDENTPYFYRKRIDSYHLTFPIFHPLFFKTGATFHLMQCLRNSIISKSDKNKPYILTTRIDSDDAFHIDAIKEIQSFFMSYKKECFLNYNFGIQYDINNRVAVKIRYENNHFSSRMEKNTGNLETVISYDHTRIDKIDRVHSIENKTKPMWIEIIHESNISNTIRLSKPLFKINSIKEFNLNLPLNKRKALSFFINYLKKITYDHLASLFAKIGLFNEFKNLIRLCK